MRCFEELAIAAEGMTKELHFEWVAVDASNFISRQTLCARLA